MPHKTTISWPENPVSFSSPFQALAALEARLRTAYSSTLGDSRTDEPDDEPDILQPPRRASHLVVRL